MSQNSKHDLGQVLGQPKCLLNRIPAVDGGEGGCDGGCGVADAADRVGGGLVGGGCAVAGDGLAPLGVRGGDGEDARAVLGAGEVEGAVLQDVVHQLLEEGVAEVLDGGQEEGGLLGPLGHEEADQLRLGVDVL